MFAHLTCKRLWLCTVRYSKWKYSCHGRVSKGLRNKMLFFYEENVTDKKRVYHVGLFQRARSSMEGGGAGSFWTRTTTLMALFGVSLIWYLAPNRLWWAKKNSFQTHSIFSSAPPGLHSSRVIQSGLESESEKKPLKLKPTSTGRPMTNVSFNSIRRIIKTVFHFRPSSINPLPLHSEHTRKHNSSLYSNFHSRKAFPFRRIFRSLCPVTQ